MANPIKVVDAGPTPEWKTLMARLEPHVSVDSRPAVARVIWESIEDVVAVTLRDERVAYARRRDELKAQLTKQITEELRREFGLAYGLKLTTCEARIETLERALHNIRAQVNHTGLGEASDE